MPVGDVALDAFNSTQFARPIYLNFGYPLPANPPFVPQQSPSGLYRRMFNTAHAAGRRYRLICDGADRYLEVFLNGYFVGMSKDSRLPAEFDVTDRLIAGDNRLACRVLKFCDGSYLEDQAMWRLSGLQRGVSLRSTADRHIGDIQVRADADGRLQISVTLAGATEDALRPLVVKLTPNGSEGRPVDLPQTTATLPTASTNTNDFHAVRPNAAVLKPTVPAVKQWTAETPNLYRAVVTRSDPDGHVLDVESADVGFRTIGLKDGFVRVNGRRVVFTGVDPHEFDHRTGKTISEARMVGDIRLMKRCNINSVHTSRYPNRTC